MPYSLNFAENDCLFPTALGAYHVACTRQPERVRRFLFMLMKNDQAANVSQVDINTWAEQFGIDYEEMLDFLYMLQELNFIEVLADADHVPMGPLEQILPPRLTAFSGSGRALLSDRQGLYIANVGFAHETAEELSALAADMAALHERHRYLVNSNLGLKMGAWGLLNARGNSQIGFWPIYIDSTEFNLVIADAPYLNQRAFRDLIWILSRRYSDDG